MTVDAAVRLSRRHREARAAERRQHALAHPRPDRRAGLRAFVMVALAAPAIVAVSSSMDAPPRMALMVGLLYAAIQLPLLTYAVRRLPSGGAPVEQGGSGPEPSTHADLLHELRSTVAGLVITHDVIRRSGPALPDHHRDRLLMLEDAELSRLARMVTRQGRSGPSSPTALALVLEPIVATLRLQGLEILWAGTDAVADLYGDDLAEIVHILLDNARVHAPGAAVGLDVSSEARRTVLTVSDHGPGVPEADADRLFGRGFRADSSPGQGLGLHMARRLARQMGGDLRLRPTPGGGCTFVLSLPTQKASACPARSA